MLCGGGEHGTPVTYPNAGLDWGKHAALTTVLSGSLEGGITVSPFSVVSE